MRLDVFPALFFDVLVLPAFYGTYLLMERMVGRGVFKIIRCRKRTCTPYGMFLFGPLPYTLPRKLFNKRVGDV